MKYSKNKIKSVLVATSIVDFYQILDFFDCKNINFKFLKIGDSVNIEFDMIGKYISKIISSSSN